jgi:hypothetical protein
VQSNRSVAPIAEYVQTGRGNFKGIMVAPAGALERLPGDA